VDVRRLGPWSVRHADDVWASDYPYPDSTFPHSREAIAHAFQGLERAFVEQVTATNCARLYGFA